MAYQVTIDAKGSRGKESECGEGHKKEKNMGVRSSFFTNLDGQVLLKTK